jgi:hypothetical protein
MAVVQLHDIATDADRAPAGHLSRQRTPLVPAPRRLSGLISAVPVS